MCARQIISSKTKVFGSPQSQQPGRVQSEGWRCSLLVDEVDLLDRLGRLGWSGWLDGVGRLVLQLGEVQRLNLHLVLGQ